MSETNKLDAIYTLSDRLLLYSLVSHEYESRPRDYGGEEALHLYPIEIHLLSEIGRCPGISAQELARRFYRTKGAISQRIKVLVGHGLIEKRSNADNHRISDLYVTEKGAAYCRHHEAFEADLSDRFLQLLQDYSTDDIARAAEIVRLLTDDLHSEE